MSVQDDIRKQVTTNPVVLYMKGTPDFPQCGFSATAVQILKACGVPDLFSVNVLEDPDIRQGIKEFANWPTIPQLYVGGRVRWRLGHHARDVPERRVAEAGEGEGHRLIGTALAHVGSRPSCRLRHFCAEPRPRARNRHALEPARGLCRRYGRAPPPILPGSARRTRPPPRAERTRAGRRGPGRQGHSRARPPSAPHGPPPRGRPETAVPCVPDSPPDRWPSSTLRAQRPACVLR